MSRLPSWRTNEPPPGQPEGLRLRTPVVRTSDFVERSTQEEAVEQKPARPAEAAVRKEAKPAGVSAPPSKSVEPPQQPPPAAPPNEPPAVVVQPSPDEDAPLLDLRSAARFIWARRTVILALCIFGALLGALAVPLTPQKFTAETSLYFDPRQAGASDPSQASMAPELVTTLIDSQTQILSSGKVLERVVDALKLDQDPQFNGGNGGENARFIAIAALQKALSIAREASTYVVSVKVTTRDPAKSARIANQLVQAFMEEEATAAAGQYKNANAALNERLEQLRQQVFDSERAVESFRAANDMMAIQGNLISDKRLTSLNDLLLAAQQRTFEAKARADAARKLRVEDVVANGQPDGGGAASPALATLRQQYAAQAAAVGSLESQLGPRHPRLQAARSSLESVAGSIRGELQRQAAAAQADYERARRAEQDISGQLNVQKATQVTTSGKVVELNELQRKAAASREVYEGLMKRSGQASETQGLTEANVRVISEAQPPLKADGPGRKVLTVAGLIAGALLGIGLGMVIAILQGLFGHPALRRFLSA
ncbi:GumC family protein [Rhizobium sp. RAF56]|uniref:GumC family protein n=1 Tax=Rhizobium sp. RAF56 TaxID=3233062 RepID=UPI003F9D3448